MEKEEERVEGDSQKLHLHYATQHFCPGANDKKYKEWQSYMTTLSSLLQANILICTVRLTHPWPSTENASILLMASAQRSR